MPLINYLQCVGRLIEEKRIDNLTRRFTYNDVHSGQSDSKKSGVLISGVSIAP